MRIRFERVPILNGLDRRGMLTACLLLAWPLAVATAAPTVKPGTETAQASAQPGCCPLPAAGTSGTGETMLQGLTMIFDTGNFPPRWRCGVWPSWLGWMHIISDVAIFLAYMAIPLTLMTFIRRRPDMPFGFLFWLFSAFIICCGLTHLLEAVIFYWPAYRLAGLLKFLTAAVSIGTVICLAPIIPKAFTLKTPTQMQEEIDRQTAALRTAVSRLDKVNEALEESRMAAQSASRMKSEFLANMSHEIRTPMTAILGFSELLADNVHDPGDADAVQTIRRNGEHLLNLINDILDLSKVESGKIEVEQIAFSPRQLLKDVEDLMRDRAHAKTLGLEVKTDANIPDLVISDPTRLKQIIVNLVGNAIKFTESGGVRVEGNYLSGDNPMLEIAVIDTGIGMTSEQLARIFRPFEQADASTTRKYGGTGLGMTISRRLAQLLGGDIHVESVPGKGTRFILTIAAESARGRIAEGPARETSSVPVTAGARSLNGCRILLAEDSPDGRALLQNILKREGAVIDLAADGVEAVKAAMASHDEGHPYHVILMDVQMPVLDGRRATSTLRSRGYTNPIVALSADAMPESRLRFLEAGGDGYAVKPIDRKALLALVARWYRATQHVAGA